MSLNSTSPHPTEKLFSIRKYLLRQVLADSRLKKLPDGDVVGDAVHLHPAKQVLADESGQLVLLVLWRSFDAFCRTMAKPVLVSMPLP